MSFENRASILARLWEKQSPKDEPAPDKTVRRRDDLDR